MKKPQILTGLITVLTTVSLHAVDDFSWNVAGPADWNNPANWANINVGTGNNDRFVNNGGIAEITADTTLPIRDIKVGMGGAGNIGTVNNLSGVHSSAGGSWIFIGVDGGTGTYNLANTAGTGGTYTGFAQGTGSLTTGNPTAGQLRVGAATGSNGTLNINTTGSVSVGNDLFVGDSAIGKVNMDSGTFTQGSGWALVGSGTGGDGTWKMSNGTVNLQDLYFGVNNGTGTGTIDNGLLNVTALRVGDNDGWGGQGGTGTLNINGGIITSANQFQVGRNGAKGFVVQTAGTVNVNGGWFAVANDHPNSTGSSYDLSGGDLNLNNGIGAEIGADTAGSMTVSSSGKLNGSGTVHVGLRTGGNGTLNISGGGEVNAVNGVSIGTNAGASGTVNGNGGTIFAPTIGKGAGAAQFNANGVKFKARSNQAEVLPGLSTATVELQTNGLKVDSNGFTIATGVALDGIGGLTKLGAGTLTLSGASTYTGSTVVEDGTLALTGSIGASPTIMVRQPATFDVSGVGGGFNLASGQTLAGKGTVIGNTTLQGGSVLSPGESVGTLTFTGNVDLTLEVAPIASAALLFELDTVTASDLALLTTGILNIGTGLEFDDFVFTALGGFGPGTYTLFDTNNALLGGLGANVNGFISGNPATIVVSGDGQDVQVNVVPEPSTLLALLSGATVLVLRRRRRE